MKEEIENYENEKKIQTIQLKKKAEQIHAKKQNNTGL